MMARNLLYAMLTAFVLGSAGCATDMWEDDDIGEEDTGVIEENGGVIEEGGGVVE